MTDEEKQIEQEAVRWIRRAANKRLIIEKFASPDVYKASLTPMLIFTAGSPGAGKTEFIKGFREAIESVVLTKVVVMTPTPFAISCQDTREQIRICFSVPCLSPLMIFSAMSSKTSRALS